MPHPGWIVTCLLFSLHSGRVQLKLLTYILKNMLILPIVLLTKMLRQPIKRLKTAVSSKTGHIGMEKDGTLILFWSHSTFLLNTEIASIRRLNSIETHIKILHLSSKRQNTSINSINDLILWHFEIKSNIQKISIKQ